MDILLDGDEEEEQEELELWPYQEHTHCPGHKE